MVEFVVPESDQAGTISLWVNTLHYQLSHTVGYLGSRASNGNLWKVMLDFNDGPNGMLTLSEGQRKTGGRYPVGDNTWEYLAITFPEIRKFPNRNHSLFVDGYKEELYYKNIDFSISQSIRDLQT